MILELSLGALALAAYWRTSRAERALANLPPHILANREAIYDTAINSLKDPAKLRELSSAFRAQKMMAQADMLESRAQLAEAPQEVKEQRREVYRKAMASRDKAAVLDVATAFEKMGATGAAASLKHYAEGLAGSNIEIGSEV